MLPMQTVSLTPLQLLQRTYPGQLPQVARNIFHLVAPVDFTDPEDLGVVATLTSFMERGIPLRFGFVPLTSTPNAVAQAKIVYYLLENHGLKALMSYLQDCHQNSLTTADEKAFTNAIEGTGLLPDSENLTFPEILKAESYSEQIKLAQHWVKRLGADSTVRPIFANGFAVPREKAWMQTMSMKLNEDLQIIQRGVYLGGIEESGL